MIDSKRYGPWALIVGGSEGIGEAFASKLADAGINLLLIARKPEPLEQTAARLRSRAPVEVRTLLLDVTRADAAARILAAAEGLEVGMLIHNVGGGYGAGPYLDHSLDEIMGTIRANCTLQSELVHHFAPRMVERGAGGIVFVGSGAGNIGSYNFASYSGAKAFTQAFGEALWAELGPKGVDVAVVVVISADTPARRRSGVIDQPGAFIAGCDAIAELGLSGLGQGPVHVLPENEDFFRMAYEWPREKPVAMLRDMMTRMTGG